MNETVTEADLLALDSELRDVLEAQRARGWRDVEANFGGKRHWSAVPHPTSRRRRG